MRGLVTALVTVALAASLCATASAADRLQLIQVGRLRLPDRGYVIDLPRHALLAPGDVVVRENGRPVENLRMMPLEQTATTVGVVLAVDASDSMRGPSFRGALAAARTLVARKNANQKIGLLAFNERAYVLLKPSADARAVRSALAHAPALAAGTHIYDAVSRALLLLDQARVGSGAVVLLSDGADTGSSLSERALIEQAQHAHVRVFTVGLRSRTFDSSALRALARGTGASYAEAKSSKDLQAIYDSLGRQLASEYLLEYRSTAGPGTRVQVNITIRHIGTADLAYTAGARSGFGPFQRSLFERFWTSAASMLFIGLLGMLLAAGAAVALLRRPPGTLVGRLSAYLSIREEPEEERRPLLSERLLTQTERSLSKTAWWLNLQEELEIARIAVAPEQIVVGAAVATLLVAIVLGSIWLPLVIVAALVPVVARGLIRRQLGKLREAFVDQLPDNLQVLASALRAGHSFVGAFTVVANDAPEPAKREFQRVVADEQLGVPLEASLRDVARRMQSADIEQVALLAELQREAGGNMAEVLDTVVETIRDRFDLRRLVKTLTAQGRMARWILSLLPAFLLCIIGLLNPAYMQPLFGTTFGRVVLLIATGMVIVGSLLIKRIVNIKV